MQISDDAVEAFGRSFWPRNTVTHIEGAKERIREALEAALSAVAEPVRYERQTSDGWLVVEAEDIPHYQGRGQQIRPLYAAPVDQTARIVELEQALSNAASQLERAYNDTCKQAAGFGLVTSDGREFSCHELNNCCPAAEKARSFIKPIFT